MKMKHLCTTILITSFIFLWSCSSSLDRIQTNPSSTINQADSEEQASRSKKEKNLDGSETLAQENASFQDDPLSVLEDALYVYQDSQLAWEKGDFDTALATLDDAYSLILKLNLPPDSSLIQEKNDLRLLIAQRIQEIYASQLTAVGNNHQTIPLVENEHVENQIKRFQNAERKFFEKSYKRSGLYMQMILEELRKAGLPEELAWVPLIESGFQVRAYSRARALGPWQFISSTGYRYGLKRDRWIDERMDPIKSTKAALKYLHDLHSHFGDWTTALAAYNCGEYKVKKVIRNQRFNYLDNFWDLYLMLPRETASFVPRFIATLLIVNDPEKYGFNLPTPDTPLEFVRLPMNSPIRLSSLSKAMGLKENVLSSLNPELRHGATPGYEYVLRVPLGFAEKAMIALNTLPTWIPPEATYRIHRVRRGESLSLIAQRYRTSISAIARLNRLRRVDLIKSGQRLKIPVRGRSYASSPPPKLVKEGEKLIYIVRRGDSLYKIASAFSTTVGKIRKDNSLESDKLDVGQKIVIQSSIPQGATIYTVRRGDSPSGIANKYGMNLSILLSLNSLNYRSKIYPGQELWVVPKKQGSN
ncbi:MAG: LysM peptidoglycan-binding domain-containing protein [Candidatus Aminicenantes bacterium]|nr:MAG: LysM peptidoglycan-binding domain-containing protein [Candidatus Aminicenantes bacterium]